MWILSAQRLRVVASRRMQGLFWWAVWGRLVQVRRHRCNNLIGQHRKARNGRRRKCLAGPVSGAGTMSEPRQGLCQDLERPDDPVVGNLVGAGSSANRSSSIRLLRAWEGQQDAEHIKGGVAAEPGTASGRKPGVGPLSTSRGHGKAKGAMPCNIGVDMWHANDR